MTGSEAADLTLETLLASATIREPLTASDGKSGAYLEAVTIADRRYVLKHVGGDGDWVARAAGDIDCLAVRVWTSGLLDELPDCLEHAVFAVEYGPTRRQGKILQQDVGPWLVPEGDTKLAHAQHRQFIDHMAILHASFWDYTDNIGLLPLENRYLLLSPIVVETEHARGHVPSPLPYIPQGWERMAVLAPEAAEIARAVQEAPALMLDPLRETPQTLLHGDWKAGNLGVHPDGRTIILDWTLTGSGPACSDLAWYLAINSARLPETKEATITAYRASLERLRVDTADWWEPQLDLCIVSAFVMLGWSKALGDTAELTWWTDRVQAAARWLR